MLHIRDDAFAQLGDRDLADGKVEGNAPAFTITAVRENPDPRILRRISGTFTVPCYLDRPGCPPGARFNYAGRAKDALPGPAAGQHADRELRVRDPAGRADDPGARRALRPRPARRPQPDRRDEHPRHVRGARLRVLRDGVERHVGGGRPERGEAARRPLGLLEPRRPQPAGLPQPALPRPPADPPAGPDRGPGVQGPGRPVAAVLRRQQPGRHPRHGADRDRARLHARGARRARDQLLRAAHAQLELGHLRRGLQPGVPARVRAPARARADQHAVGSRRGRRLGAPRDHRPARRHPRAPRPAPRLGRRLAGHDLPGRRARPHDRRLRAQAGLRARPLARARAAVRHPRHHARPVRGLGDRLLGQRPGAQRHRRRWPTRRRARAATRTTRRARPRRHGARRREFLLTGNVIDVCGGQPCQASGAIRP